jgi:hypothetical protein
MQEPWGLIQGPCIYLPKITASIYSGFIAAVIRFFFNQVHAYGSPALHPPQTPRQDSSAAGFLSASAPNVPVQLPGARIPAAAIVPLRPSPFLFPGFLPITPVLDDCFQALPISLPHIFTQVLVIVFYRKNIVRPLLPYLFHYFRLASPGL